MKLLRNEYYFLENPFLGEEQVKNMFCGFLLQSGRGFCGHKGEKGALNPGTQGGFSLQVYLGRPKKPPGRWAPHRRLIIKNPGAPPGVCNNHTGAWGPTRFEPIICTKEASRGPFKTPPLFIPKIRTRNLLGCHTAQNPPFKSLFPGPWGAQEISVHPPF